MMRSYDESGKEVIMSDEKKLCPEMSRNVQGVQGETYLVEVYCYGANCAQWDAGDKMCAKVSISDSLICIVNRLEEISDFLRGGQDEGELLATPDGEDSAPATSP